MPMEEVREVFPKACTADPGSGLAVIAGILSTDCCLHYPVWAYYFPYFQERARYSVRKCPAVAAVILYIDCCLGHTIWACYLAYQERQKLYTAALQLQQVSSV